MESRMTRSVLLLGADGYVGKQVALALPSDGWQPVELTVFDEQTLLTAMQNASAVVNCVTGSVNTITLAAKMLSQCWGKLAQPPRLIHMSTMSVYGRLTGLVNEATPLPPDLAEHPAAEAAAEKLLSSCGVIVTFRPGRVFGPGSEQGTVRIARLLLAHRLGDLGPAGDGYYNLVHVGDVVQAVLLALQRTTVESTVFNLGIDDPPTWNEFLVKFGIALGAVPVRRITPRRLWLEQNVFAPPLKIAELIARAVGMDPARLPGPMPPSFMRTLRQELRLDTRRAAAQLGLRWTSVDRMVEEAARDLLRHA